MTISISGHYKLLLHFCCAAKAFAFLNYPQVRLRASFRTLLVYPLHFITPGKASLA